MRILRTGAGSPVSEAVIQALKDEGCDVVCADSDSLAYGIHKHGGHVTSRADDGIICDLTLYDAIIPGVDEELPDWARINRFATERTIVVSPEDTIETFDSKIEANTWFVTHKIKTPETSSYSFAGAFKKGEFGRGGNINPPYVYQDYVRGTEYTIDALCDFSGKLLCGAVRERIKTKGGTSIQAKIVNRPDIWADVEKMCSLIEFNGPICLQCISNDDGNWWIDVNPRYGGGVALSIAAGVPMVSGLVKLLKGETVKPTGCCIKELTMLRYWSEVFV